MKIIGNSIQRDFIVESNGKIYNVNYLNADYQTSALLNRDFWEIRNEDGEEINGYFFESSSEEDKRKAENDANLFDKIVEFCVENFNCYSFAD